MSLHTLTINEAQTKLRLGEISAVELVNAVLTRIDATDPYLGSYLSTNHDQALDQAMEVDNVIREGGDLEALSGIPVALKDVILVEGMQATAGSKILQNFIAPYDATVTERLKRSGAIIIGKLNCDEFAMGSSNENSAYGVCRNPWDTERVAGGSSGGSAVSVAADQACASLGTDTGGSIRLPAAFCGIVGLKPTYGRVSRFGVIAYASSLDQVGPCTKTVKDSAILLTVIAGHDTRDSTSVNRPSPDYTQFIDRGVDGLRVGVPQEYFVDGLQEDVKQAINRAILQLKGFGAEIVDISMPHTEYAIAAYYVIATAEASSNLARYDGVRYGYRAKDVKDIATMYLETRANGFGNEVKRRIMLGTFVLSAGYYDAYYLKAQKVRALVRADFEEAFKTCDFMLAPVSPTTAFRIGERIDDPLTMYLSDVYTTAVNLAGLPALSVPCGFDQQNLPIGLQLIGQPFQEETIFRAGYTFERNNDYYESRPPL